MKPRRRVPIGLAGMLFLHACNGEIGFDPPALSHPLQWLAQAEENREPSLDEILSEWGYPQGVSRQPLAIERFLPVGEISLTWTDKHTDARIRIGWYQGDTQHVLLQTDNIMHIPTVLATEAEPFGIMIHSIREESRTWFSEADKNQGHSRLKVFPFYQNRTRMLNAYLLCWEEAEVVNEEADYNDVILLLTGVVPADGMKY